MSLEIDDLRRRVVVAARTGFSGTELSRAVARLIDAEPRAAAYDFVLDTRDSDTGSTLADFQIVLEAYRRAPRQPGLKYGCYVSLDLNYPLWATSMAALFGDRDCPVFETAQAAHAFLDDRRGFSAAQGRPAS